MEVGKMEYDPVSGEMKDHPSSFSIRTKPKVVQNDKYITILNNRGNFNFEKAGCTTPEAILHGVMYLCRFGWSDTQQVYEFVEMATQNASIDIEPKPITEDGG